MFRILFCLGMAVFSHKYGIVSSVKDENITNPDKLRTLKDIVLANRGNLHLILRLKSTRYGETVGQCGANFKIADKDSVFK